MSPITTTTSTSSLTIYRLLLCRMVLLRRNPSKIRSNSAKQMYFGRFWHGRCRQIIVGYVTVCHNYCLPCFPTVEIDSNVLRYQFAHGVGFASFCPVAMLVCHPGAVFLALKPNFHNGVWAFRVNGWFFVNESTSEIGYRSTTFK